MGTEANSRESAVAARVRRALAAVDRAVADLKRRHGLNEIPPDRAAVVRAPSRSSGLLAASRWMLSRSRQTIRSAREHLRLSECAIRRTHTEPVDGLFLSEQAGLHRPLVTAPTRGPADPRQTPSAVAGHRRGE